MHGQQVIDVLYKEKNEVQANILSRFFKTGKGQYGEGDIFWGITVPIQRNIAQKFRKLPLIEVVQLLHSKVHEHRLTALLIWTYQYPKATSEEQKIIYQRYLQNIRYINNWDLVDLSAPNIVGQFLLEKAKERKILYKLARSKNLWEKRIAIVSCYTFIKNNQFDDTLHIAKILLHDTHDLIHKAVGWMLREIGKRNQAIEEAFLQKYSKTMPRTMLRYAIEKFPENKRRKYLEK